MTWINCQALLALILESETRLTPRKLLKQAVGGPGSSRVKIKDCIKELVESGELVYAYDFGATHLVPSFLRPVAITRYVTLRPPDRTSKPEGNSPHKSSGHIDIILEPGISFGSGSHPTTRLCLQALDFCFHKPELDTDTEFDSDKKNCIKHALDVGCGSGVLAIAAVKAGATSCLALDLDLVSICEAEKNVRHNGLDRQIQVSDQDVETLALQPMDKQFSLIIANLRAPTLTRLARVFKTLLSRNGLVVLSGFRPEEKKHLFDIYQTLGLLPVWQKNEKSWSGVVLCPDQHD